MECGGCGGLGAGVKGERAHALIYNKSMHLQKQRGIRIDPKHPFANDKLNRSGIAATLTQLLKNSKQPFTISVEAPWGVGKVNLP